jgi:hypothetical protein
MSTEAISLRNVKKVGIHYIAPKINAKLYHQRGHHTEKTQSRDCVFSTIFAFGE